MPEEPRDCFLYELGLRSLEGEFPARVKAEKQTVPGVFTEELQLTLVYETLGGHRARRNKSWG